MSIFKYIFVQNNTKISKFSGQSIQRGPIDKKLTVVTFERFAVVPNNTASRVFFLFMNNLFSINYIFNFSSSSVSTRLATLPSWYYCVFNKCFTFFCACVL